MTDGDAEAVVPRIARALSRVPRRRGVARGLVAAAAAEAAQRGLARLVLDILASREGAITAWRRLGSRQSDDITVSTAVPARVSA